MKLLLLIGLFLFSSLVEAAQLAIPTTCYVNMEKVLIATTTSTLMASSGSDTNCWILQNQDAATSVYFNINGANNSRGHEVQAGTIYQLYTLPLNFLYVSSSAGSVKVDLLSGRTSPQ